MSSLSTGDHARSWKILDLVGLGVPQLFRARHVEVGTEALIKVVPESDATRDRQDREVRALGALKHDDIPALLDFGVDHDRAFVWTAFSWYEAEPLRDRLLGDAITWREGCTMVRQLAELVCHVHASGFVHRDLRPETVSVGSDGRVLLTGFEFAMTQDDLEQLTRAPVGDISYLAPEVLADPTHHGPRADVYALGSVMYELFVGKPAFPAAAWGERADQAARMLEWKSRSEALDPGDEFPDWLRNLVTKCTDPDPDRRLPDVEALVGWLEAARAGWEQPKLAPPPPLATMRPPVMLPDIVPSIAPKALPAVRMSQSGPGQVTRQPRSRVPTPIMFVAAAALGCLCSLGFDAVFILFLEIQRGAL